MNKKMASLVIKTYKNLHNIKFISGNISNVITLFDDEGNLRRKTTFTSDKELKNLETYFLIDKASLACIKMTFSIKLEKQENGVFIYQIVKLEDIIKEILL